MRALWNGQLPLARAFWEYAVIYALLLNICATVGTFAAVAADLPAVLAIVIYLLPAPYIVVAVVGVWRSAAAYAGPQRWATLARAASVLWGAIMVLI